MRLWLGMGLLAVCVIAIANLVYSAEKKKSEVALQTTLTTFRTALQAGTSRTQVEDYIRQQGMSFTQGPQTLSDRVSLGEEPRNLFCQPWNVYIDFQFKGSDTANGAEPGSQRLTSIDLHREGVCF